MEAVELILRQPGRPALVLANPRLDALAVAPVVAALEGNDRFAGHVAVASSGTTAAVPGENKWVLLSRDALVASAEAVNGHLAAGPGDGWISPLPIFHVGGLGIVVRAWLAGAPMTPFGAWDAAAFRRRAEECGASLTSLVPTQVYDLVTQGIAAPPRLRAAIVGGGALSVELERRARALGWPLLSSYGASECASQVATARPDDPPGTRELPLLSHVTATIDGGGRLVLRSPALLTAYALTRGGGVRFEDPKIDGALVTGDRAELRDGRLRFVGRVADVAKVGGENVDLGRLRQLLEALRLDLAMSADATLVAVNDERLGSRLELVVTGDGERLLARFNAAVMPYERARSLRRVGEIPRSPLGKVLSAALQ